MTIATTQNFFATASPLSQASIVADIKQAMGNLGYPSVFDEITGATHTLVYQIVLDGAKAKGKAYLLITVTTGLIVSQKISDNWSLATHTSDANASTAAVNVTFPAASSIQFVSVLHPELKLVLMVGTTVVQVLGFFRPANKPAWWNEEQYPYAFIPAEPTLKRFASGKNASNQFGPTFGDIYPVANAYGNVGPIENFAYANPFNKRDLLPGLVLFAPPDGSFRSKGVAGTCSPDVGVGACVGTNLLDRLVVSPGSEEYLILSNSNAGVVVRVL